MPNGYIKSKNGTPIELVDAYAREQLDLKVDIIQDVADKGKVLAVGETGNIELKEIDTDTNYLKVYNDISEADYEVVCELIKDESINSITAYGTIEVVGLVREDITTDILTELLNSCNYLSVTIDEKSYFIPRYNEFILDSGEFLFGDKKCPFDISIEKYTDDEHIYILFTPKDDNPISGIVVSNLSFIKIKECALFDDNGMEIISNNIFEGFGTNSDNCYAGHAEGILTTVENFASHAEGERTKAIGNASHSEGNSTTASGDGSHAEGFFTTAGGYDSHSEGNNTTASGNASHSEGQNTTASGYYSHSEGYNTTASGQQSHAEGMGTIASKISSHAEGSYTTANGGDQHVQGHYNIADDTSAHIVGNGGSKSKSNAHTLDWQGNAWYAGDVYVGSTSGKNKDDGSKKLATEEYVDSKVGTGGSTVTDEHINELIDNKNKIVEILDTENVEVASTRGIVQNTFISKYTAEELINLLNDGCILTFRNSVLTPVYMRGDKSFISLFATVFLGVSFSFVPIMVDNQKTITMGNEDGSNIDIATSLIVDPWAIMEFPEDTTSNDYGKVLAYKQPSHGGEIKNYEYVEWVDLPETVSDEHINGLIDSKLQQKNDFTDTYKNRLDTLTDEYILSLLPKYDGGVE